MAAIRALGSFRLRSVIALVVSIFVLRIPTAAASQAAQPLVSTGATAPSGIVVVIDPTAQGSQWRRAVKNPYVRGVAVQIDWRDVEPVEGKPDWSTLDDVFAAAGASKKWVHLLIFPGFFSPSWALNGAQTDRFAIQYGPGAGTFETLPIPWDTVYLNRWFAFVKLLSDRYGKSSALRLVAVDGPTSVSAEFTLPNAPHALKQWQNDGYRPSKYIAAWQNAFRIYAADFPDQCLSLSLGSGLNINDDGRIDVNEHLRTRQAIVDQGYQLLGDRFALQLSDVHAGAGPHSPNSEAEDHFIIDSIGRFITGFQLRTSAERDSAVMGAAGDPPLALKASIDLALQKNDAGRHVDYLEVYSPDVLAGEQQPELKNASVLFAQATKLKN
jgi:hypothetical protein